MDQRTQSLLALPLAFSCEISSCVTRTPKCAAV